MHVFRNRTSSSTRERVSFFLQALRLLRRTLSTSSHISAPSWRPGHYGFCTSSSLSYVRIPVWRRVRIPPPCRRRRQKGNTVSDETVMYGYWSSVTWPVRDCTVSNRPVLSSERALCRKNNKAIVTKERIRITSGHGPKMGARNQDELVDWPSAVR
jgi:hypothetical protein